MSNQWRQFILLQKQHLHLLMAGCAADFSDGGTLTLALEQCALVKAAANGFGHALTTCTHAVTTYTALHEMGFDFVERIDYEHFEFDGKHPFQAEADTHVGATLVHRAI